MVLAGRSLGSGVGTEDHLSAKSVEGEGGFEGVLEEINTRANY